jgi:DNA-3-methyladenine glycosylase II
VGPCSLRLERDGFRMLVRSIISQQISVHAARTIRTRVEALLKPKKLTAANLARLSVEDLRAAGVSAQKSAYLRDLAGKVLSGEVRLRRLERLADEEVIQELIQVKGIGVWTAQMFLIFSLGRPDVVPLADLGIRAALQKLYGLPERPDKQTSERIALSWKPYSSLASWYCWRSHEVNSP